MSIFDIYKVGIGPSSSHTVGPMLAAHRFLENFNDNLDMIYNIQVEVFGSLAATGIGHGTHKAIVAGLYGIHPSTCKPMQVDEIFTLVKSTELLSLLNKKTISFHIPTDLLWNRGANHHPFSNTIIFRAFDKNRRLIEEQTYYSVGGGKVISHPELSKPKEAKELPYPFHRFSELSQLCKEHNLTISQVMLANEFALRSKESVYKHLETIWSTMDSCIERGCKQEGTLPGKLKVKKRAGAIYRKLSQRPSNEEDPLATMDWVNLYALAVNEENASGSIVVTAPTNGAAGIIPAVLKYYRNFYKDTSSESTHRFLLTAAAIAMLYAKNASLSGAEVGCQGEVGVACSMAAGGLIAALQGSTEEIGQAAEIGMEHNLGLTCDPIGGLVQIPCIERNAMGAIKAINAARIAKQGSGHHYVSLDTIIKVMMETGKDMQTKYKETSRGGLAVSVVEC